MITANEISSSEECEKTRNLGYATSKHITLYGEHFEVMSDPFLQDEGSCLLGCNPCGTGLPSILYTLALAARLGVVIEWHN